MWSTIAKPPDRLPVRRPSPRRRCPLYRLEHGYGAEPTPARLCPAVLPVPAEHLTGLRGHVVGRPVLPVNEKTTPAL